MALATLTRKQRASAERERSSKTCAGCGKQKRKGECFCLKCTDKVKKMPLEIFAGFHHWYNDALHWLFEGRIVNTA